MSKIQIKVFFKFCRVKVTKLKVTKQMVDIGKKAVMIKAEPDGRYKPVGTCPPKIVPLFN